MAEAPKQPPPLATLLQQQHGEQQPPQAPDQEEVAREQHELKQRPGRTLSQLQRAVAVLWRGSWWAAEDARELCGVEGQELALLEAEGTVARLG